MLLSSCGSSAASATAPSTTAITQAHPWSYMAEGDTYVYWLQFRGSPGAVGVFEENLSPAVTPTTR